MFCFIILLCSTFVGFIVTPVIEVLIGYRFSKLMPTEYLFPFLAILNEKLNIKKYQIPCFGALLS